MDIAAVYKDLFLVSLGPYARVVQTRTLSNLALSIFGAFKYSGKTFRDIFLYGRKTFIDHPLSPGKNIWLMVGTKNNFDSLSFIPGARDDCQVVVFSKDNRRLGPFPRLNLAPQGFYWWKAIWLIPALWPSFGKMLFFHPDSFLMGLGCYERALEIVMKERPKALIFSNDHSPPIRAFAQAARHLEIPIIYVQHASISPYFPPLIFDLSLLEGRVTLNTYKQCGPVNGKVELIGMPKFDPFLDRRNFSKEIHRIGVCSNMLDKEYKVAELLHSLSEKFPHIELAYRPHPRDQRQILLPAGVILSDSKQEGVFDFLSKQDLIIAGDTSIHLEATLLNVVSLYYHMGGSVEDYYGFVANGLVEKIDELPVLINWIEAHLKDRPEVFLKAKPFHELVGTPMEGKSCELALQYLEECINGGSDES